MIINTQKRKNLLKNLKRKRNNQNKTRPKDKPYHRINAAIQKKVGNIMQHIKD